MTIHIATPEEIEGSLDDSEILVLHLTGPKKGMILANKKNDATVAAAIAAGEVVQVETPSSAAGGGSTTPALPPVDSTVTFRSFLSSNNVDTLYGADLDGGTPKLDYSTHGTKHKIRIVHDTGKTDADYAAKMDEEVRVICADMQNDLLVPDATPDVYMHVKDILPLIASRAVLEIYQDSHGVRLKVLS